MLRYSFLVAASMAQIELFGGAEMIKNMDGLFCNLEGSMTDGTGTPTNLIFHFR